MRNLNLILVLALSLVPFATVQAAPADLPETGQTTCTNATGAVIACAGTGQDGELRAGVAWPNPRFVVGTGATADCVTDNLTGLMWMREPNLTFAVTTWVGALTNANDTVLCGFNDWRLPNINELESLVNSESANTTIFLNTQGFIGVQVGYYWSSSSLAASAGSAWTVYMGDGSATPDVKSRSYYVWPVRAGR